MTAIASFPCAGGGHQVHQPAELAGVEHLVCEALGTIEQLTDEIAAARPATAAMRRWRADLADVEKLLGAVLTFCDEGEWRCV